MHVCMGSSEFGVALAPVLSARPDRLCVHVGGSFLSGFVVGNISVYCMVRFVLGCSVLSDHYTVSIELHYFIKVGRAPRN